MSFGILPTRPAPMARTEADVDVDAVSGAGRRRRFRPLALVLRRSPAPPAPLLRTVVGGPVEISMHFALLLARVDRLRTIVERVRPADTAVDRVRRWRHRTVRPSGAAGAGHRRGPISTVDRSTSPGKPTGPSGAPPNGWTARSPIAQRLVWRGDRWSPPPSTPITPTSAFGGSVRPSFDHRIAYQSSAPGRLRPNRAPMLGVAARADISGPFPAQRWPSDSARSTLAGEAAVGQSPGSWRPVVVSWPPADRTDRPTAAASSPFAGGTDRRLGADRGPAPRPVALVDRQTAERPAADRSPVDRVHRTWPKPAADGRAGPAPVPTSPGVVAVPAAPPIDLDRLDRDLWRRFEKRIKVEKERRGRRLADMAQELAKAMIVPLDGRQRGQEIAVLFNPAEYSVEYSASFQETAPPGLSNPIIQFVNGNAQVLTMELLFDTYTDGGGENVLEQTSRFTELVSIDALTHAPPRVRFHWGRFEFVAVVEKVSQRLTMFRSDGTPVRANLSVTFKQYKTIAEQLDDPRRNSADKTKRRVFAVHDRVDLLADREYGEPRYWRLIARRNDIDDPRQIEAGRVLVLPPLTDDDVEVSRDADR